MWWSRAILCLMVLAAGPVGCGFQPIYARPGGAASSPVAERLAGVRIDAISDRAGQQLRNTLVSTLNPGGEPASPEYLLTVRLSETNQSLATSKDGNAAVGNIFITANYEMTDTRSGAVVYVGSARAFSGYRYLGPRYASTASERESRNSALVELASEIRGTLAAYFSDPERFGVRRRVERLQPLGPDMPLGEAE